MATRTQKKDLVDRLHAGGLRKSANGVVEQVQALVREVEDRLGTGSAKRRAAGHKAAATRKRNAAKRTAAAKKAAQTRAKSGRKR
jgi:hypothetical protein